jgi:hypothetical protein
MHYHVSQQGVNIGKYSETDIVRCLADGTFTHSDHYWAVGMPGWLPLSHFRPGTDTNVASRSLVSTTSAMQMGGSHAGTAPANHAHAHAHPNHPVAPSGQMFGYLGGALLALGVFGPAVELGKLSISIIANGNSKGVLMIVLGCCGALLAHLRQFVFIWIPAGSAALILGDICLSLLDAPSASLFGTTIRLAPGWGLFVMLAGNVLLLCSAWKGYARKKP